MSVHFSHKHFRGLTHEKVLQSLSDAVNIKSVKSIQLTDKMCVITLNDEDSKTSLLTSELVIDNQSVKTLSVEKNITNVVIKDAPCEMSDSTIATFMTQFGEVLNASVRRGKIKNTEIENGTRYLQMTQCKPLLPLTSYIGRFPIRIFADNNRTECYRCGQTDHPSFKCPQRQVYGSRSCYRCGDSSHLIKDCPQPDQRACHQCGQSGHLSRDCPDASYGQYAQEIRDGREADREDRLAESDGKTTTNNPDTSNVNNVSHVNKRVILGASNCKRVQFDQSNTVNASIGGATYAEIDEVVDKAGNMLGDEKTDKVVINLGTVDVCRNQKDPDHITVNVTAALDVVKDAFPGVPVGICSIIPRRGKGEHAKQHNETARSVNTFLKKLCDRHGLFSFIDVHNDFVNEHGFAIGALYDKDDNNGIHINPAGQDHMLNKINVFLNTPTMCPPATYGRKRARSSTSTPGQEHKLHKTDH